MAQVVADSSSLIHLEKIGQLALLEGLFEQVVIPQAVADEVQRTLPELPSWIHVHTLSRRVILDDLMARTFGRALGLEVVGTGAVLYLMVDTDLNRSLVPVDHEMGIAFL